MRTIKIIPCHSPSPGSDTHLCNDKGFCIDDGCQVSLTN